MGTKHADPRLRGHDILPRGSPPFAPEDGVFSPILACADAGKRPLEKQSCDVAAVSKGHEEQRHLLRFASSAELGVGNERHRVTTFRVKRGCGV